KRRIAVAACRGDFQVSELHRQFRQRIAVDAARSQIEFGVRTQFCPFQIRRANSPSRGHVSWYLFLFCALQKKYTGIPANKIPNPTAVLRGYLKIVLITTSQDAATNRKVVTGCPGIRARPFSGVRRPSLKSRRR